MVSKLEMDENRRNIEKEVNITMESLTEIKPAKGNPFLYEKVMNRMNSRPAAQSFAKYKYALIIAVFLILNSITLINFTPTETAISATLSEQLQNFAEEYNLNINNYNY